MAVVEMVKRRFYNAGYQHTETISNGSTGNVIIIPPLSKSQNITCTLIAGANTGKFQVTTSSDAAVTAGTATWQDWAKGEQTGTVSDAIISPVTAIRGVSTSGEIAIEVVL